MFPKAKTYRPPKNNRIMFNAMLCLSRSRTAWADIPERYGLHKTVYSRFCQWRDDGILLSIFKALNEKVDFKNVSIDSTSIKSTSIKRGRKKWSTNSENNQFICSCVCHEANCIVALMIAMNYTIYIIALYKTCLVQQKLALFITTRLVFKI